MEDAGAIIGAIIGVVIWLAVIIFFVICGWKIFVKAGQPGWACIIPIYNVYIMLKVAGKPGWWIILLIIPLVNIIVGIMATVAFARSFGKSTGFGIGLLLLGIIFYPILAFGSAQYVGPGGSAEAQA